jgi:hypothetical protein
MKPNYAEVLRNGTFTEVIDATLDQLETAHQRQDAQKILESVLIEAMSRGADCERSRMTQYVVETLTSYLQQSETMRQSGDLIVIVPPHAELN